MSSFSIILGRDDPPKSNSTKTGMIATPAISLPVLVVKCVDQVLWRGGGIIRCEFKRHNKTHLINHIHTTLHLPPPSVSRSNSYRLGA